jgi:hypothetical protein
MEHGLPEDKVLALLVDRTGFLWIGTRAGVARFDGQHFQVWSRSTEPAFLEDTCQALAEDHQGNLWVGTSSGLVRLGTNNAHLSLAGLVPTAAITERGLVDVVTSLLVTRQGELLVGTMFGLHAQTAQGTWKDGSEMGAFPDEHVMCLAEATDASLWAGTTNPTADSLDALAARLCDRVEQAARAAGLRCRIDVPEEYPVVSLGPAYRRDVLLAVREAVTNAVRHARAEELTLRIASRDGRWTIEVRDDGIGFEPGQRMDSAADHEHGLGLRSIRERMHNLGGVCRINSQRGSGTAVVLELLWPSGGARPAEPT